MLNQEILRSWIPPDFRGRSMRPYYMPLTTSAAIAAGTSDDLTVQLQNVAAFLVAAVVGRVYTSGAPDTSVASPPLTIDLEFSSGDKATSGAVPWSAIVTDDGSPNEGLAGLIIPRIVVGGSTITATIASYSSATGYLVRLGLCGVSIYNT